MSIVCIEALTYEEYLVCPELAAVSAVPFGSHGLLNREVYFVDYFDLWYLEGDSVLFKKEYDVMVKVLSWFDKCVCV